MVMNLTANRKMAMKASDKNLYRTSRGLDGIAHKRTLVDLTAIADGCISPSGLEEKKHPERWEPEDIAEQIEIGLQLGIVLATKAYDIPEFERIAGKRIQPIWVVAIPEAMGDCLLFFVGTYGDIAAKIRELPSDWE